MYSKTRMQIILYQGNPYLLTLVSYSPLTYNVKGQPKSISISLYVSQVTIKLLVELSI